MATTVPRMLCTQKSRSAMSRDCAEHVWNLGVINLGVSCLASEWGHHGWMVLRGHRGWGIATRDRRSAVIVHSQPATACYIKSYCMSIMFDQRPARSANHDGHWLRLHTTQTSLLYINSSSFPQIASPTSRYYHPTLQPYITATNPHMTQTLSSILSHHRTNHARVEN